MFIQNIASDKDTDANWRRAVSREIVVAFEERVIRNRQIHGVGKMYSLWMLNILRLGYTMEGPGFDLRHVKHISLYAETSTATLMSIKSLFIIYLGYFTGILGEIEATSVRADNLIIVMC